MNNFASRFLLGGIIVFFGVVLLLDQLGIGYGIGRLWPLVIVVLGIYMIMHNFRNVLPGLFVLMIGIFLQLDALRIFSFSIWNLWPLFIIFAGVSVLIGRRDRHGYSGNYSSSNATVEHGFVDAHAVFWAEEKIVKGEFTGAKLEAVFGGLKLDLRDAEIKDKVVIDVNLVFGGLELLLPTNAKVVNKGVGVIGGLSDKSRPTATGDDLKTVEITGSAVFGGVDVK